MIQFYRSKSQNMSSNKESGVNPKSHISSPMEISNSTLKNKSTIPTTLKSDSLSGSVENPKESQSSIKKSKRQGSKAYCKMSSIDKSHHVNDSSRQFSKLNLKSSKRAPQNNSKNFITQNNGNRGENLDNEQIASLVTKCKLVHMSSESRSNGRGSNFHSIKTRPSQNATHGGSMQSNSNMNSSASTTVLRTNYNIINMKSSKEGSHTKYGSVSKFTKKNTNKY